MYEVSLRVNDSDEGEELLFPKLQQASVLPRALQEVGLCFRVAFQQWTGFPWPKYAEGGGEGISLHGSGGDDRDLQAGGQTNTRSRIDEMWVMFARYFYRLLDVTRGGDREVLQVQGQKGLV